MDSGITSSSAGDAHSSAGSLIACLGTEVSPDHRLVLVRGEWAVRLDKMYLEDKPCRAHLLAWSVSMRALVLLVKFN